MDDEDDPRVERFNQDLLSEDDLGAIVRGHLWVENELITFVEARIVDREALKRLDLGYSGRVDLALALGLKSSLKSALSALGSLRNRFAHRLGIVLIKSDADNLYNAFDPSAKSIIRQAHDSTHSQLGTTSPPRMAAETPKMRCILCIINLWAALVAENTRPVP